MLIILLLLFSATVGCQGKKRDMATWDLGKTQRRCVGRFYLYLPESATLTRQTQSVDGITLQLAPRASNASLDAILADRRREIRKDPDSPIVTEYHWGKDMGGILYVGDTSDPTYLALEGRRLLNQHVFAADTNGDKSKTEIMVKIVTEALGNFQPGQAPDGDAPCFCLDGGVLRQAFRNGEEVHASLRLPQPGAKLDIDTEVIAVPGKIDLIERVKEAAEIARRDRLSVEFLRQGRKKVSGIDGMESVMAVTEKDHTDFDARFEAAGLPASPQEPEMRIHLTAGEETGYRSGSMSKEQFLSLWDGLLARISSHP